MFPGEPTQIWRYRVIVNKGAKNRVIELPRSYLGPIIKVHQGEKIRIRFTNSIPEKSIIHWHGLHVPAIMDGHPRHVVSQGRSYLYEFEVNNRSRGLSVTDAPEKSSNPRPDPQRGEGAVQKMA